MTVAHAASPAATDARRSLPTPLANWLDAILMVAAHYRLECSREHIRVSASWQQDDALPLAVRQMARQAGLSLRLVAPDVERITTWRLPLVIQFDDGQVALVRSIGREGYEVSFSGDAGLTTTLTEQALRDRVVSIAVMRPAQGVPDVRVDEYIKPAQPHWLRSIILQDMRPFRHVMWASLIINILSLAGIFFMRQVFDRVIPAQSYPTLYVLFGGVLIAFLFVYMLRHVRSRVIDVVGKRADMRLSDRVFGRALRVRSSARPKATGTFVAQIRELEHVREMLTSTTVTAIADLPFFLLFYAIFWYIAPSLAWIPLAGFVLLIVPSVLAQRKLRALAQSSMRENSLRNGLLMESVQGLEDIKMLQAEPRFQNQWNHYNATNAESGLRLRALTHKLTNWIQTVQGAAFAVVVFFGAPQVMDGDISTGTMMAAAILCSRMIGPLAGLAQILNRWQQAKVASESLGAIMKLPVDDPEDEHRIHRPYVQGEYVFKDAVFSHDGQTAALRVDALTIRAGERVVILGRNGAGKSTLLQALSGLIEPMSGTLMLDGANMQHIDPADVRRDVGLVSQQARLFHGTLRENLTLGAPHAADDDIARALHAAGAWEFVQRLPAGMDHLVLEGGVGLSGGQRQSLLLARMLIRQPHVLLLDEPTASLDDTAEKQVIDTLKGLDAGQTMVIATHRMSVLDLADRVLVLSNGRIVLDDARDQALKKLKAAARPKAARARAVAATTATSSDASDEQGAA